jgi:type I restriction enzyme M protein
MVIAKKTKTFGERFRSLKAEFEAQLLEEAALNASIAENLAKVKLP